MADYYTIACFTIPMTEEQAEYTIKELKAYSENEDLDAKENPASSLIFDELSFQPDVYSSQWGALSLPPGALFIVSHDGPRHEALDKFIQHLIQKFNLPPVAYTWGSFCTQYEEEAFDGGAVFITAQEIKYLNPYEWIDDQRKQV